MCKGNTFVLWPGWLLGSTPPTVQLLVATAGELQAADRKMYHAASDLAQHYRTRFNNRPEAPYTAV